MRRLFLIPSLTLTLLGAMTGCGTDTQNSSARLGQQCFQSEDCVSGLRCVARQCVAVSELVPVDSTQDTTDETQDTADDSTELRCELGERACVNAVTVRQCVTSADGQNQYEEEACPPNQLCSDGVCLDDDPIGACIDEDNDGAFLNCTPLDCDDTDPSRAPNVPERCGNNIDDNCDQRVDEDCGEPGLCCDGGCPQGQTCDECACKMYDADRCEYQDQPCNQEGFDGSYFCGALVEDGPLRCIGICNVDAQDPNSTCPGSNSVCAFEAGGQGSEGICTSTCTQAQGCGIVGVGCLLTESSDQEGICVPTNEANPIGARCNSDDFFDCAEGGFCTPFGRRPVCAQSCRPFSGSLNGESDCQRGTSCLPFGDFGICVQNNDVQGEGADCDSPGTPCGEDAVICSPDGNSICRRECRATGSNEQSEDCAPGNYCLQNQNNERGMGVCEPI